MTPVPTPACNGWILVEHAGPWGSQPATASPFLPADVRAAAQRRNLRIQLVRRIGQRRTPSPFTCLLVSGVGGARVVEQGHLSDTAALLDADLDALAAGRPAGFGTPLDGALYLVCTQRKPDLCCVDNGAPVAAALAAVGGSRVWETSHVGGCRFAANVVCLPDGIRYVNVTVADAARLVAATDQRRIWLPPYGGRHGQNQLVQLADRQLRHRLRLYGVDDVRAAAQRALPGGRVEIILLAHGVPYRLVLHRDATLPQRAAPTVARSGRHGE